MSTVRRKAQVVRAAELSPSVRGLALSVEGAPLAFEPGQWLHLHVPTPSGVAKRAYSIASAPGTGLVEIAVTRVEDGAASTALHAMEPGATLEVDGPHGFFTRTGALREEKAVFVATGTGLAPFRSMLQAEASCAGITLLFGCRSEADILWRSEFDALARERGLRYEVTLSRGGPAWGGRRGYVQRHVAELARELGTPHVFVCGLNRMVSEVRALCKGELGYDRKRIHTERYD